MAELILKKSAALLLRHELPEGTITIGRDEKCDLMIASDQIAKLHVTVTGKGGRFQMRHRAGGPIRCKGKNFERRILEPGDEVAIGDYTLVFSNEVSEPPLAVKGNRKKASAAKTAKKSEPGEDQTFIQELVAVIEADLEERGLSIAMVAKFILFIVIVFSLGRVWGALF